MAGALWPQLFEQFDVQFVPPSASSANPLKTNPMTAEEIIRKLSSIPSLLQQYTSQVRTR